MKSVEFLVPEVKKINENLDTIMLLNNIEHILVAMMKFDKVQKASSLVSNNQASIAAKMQAVIDCVVTAKRNILDNEQDAYVLYKALVELLTEITTEFKALPSGGIMSYLSRESVYKGYSSLYGAFFGWGDADEQKTFDPLVELELIIKKMSTAIGQIEDLRNIIAKHKAAIKSPSI
jgi:hypothetical protein